MLARTLTYQIPFERIVKLSRSMGRKVYTVTWLSLGAVLVLFVVGMVLLIIFDREVQEAQEALGLPWFSMFLALAVIYLVSIYLIRRQSLMAMKARGDFGQDVRLTAEADGLRFATNAIEHLVKWRGVTELRRAPDGAIVATGNLFFLIPDIAFSDGEERDRFVSDLFARISEPARERSDPAIREIAARKSQAG